MAELGKRNVSDKPRLSFGRLAGRRAEPPAEPLQPETSPRFVPRSPGEALEPVAAAPPPLRSRQARNRFVVFFNFLISSTVLAVLFSAAVLYFGEKRFLEEGPLQTARTIMIREGSSLADIASLLEARGIIDNEFIFRVGVIAHRSQTGMKAGEYAFQPGMSMHDVMEALRQGKGVIHKVSVPEGLTSYQIMQRIAENEILVGDMPDEIPPEGSLMPDTYPFQRGLERRALIEQMKSAQRKFLDEVWSRRVPGLPVSTPEEMVILASIVEKETGKADERPRVASVFINRLNRGMKLQSDPTILYGLFGGEGKPKDRPIYQSDIDKPTEYNTYHIDGLPPGPIANPGRAALEAVANPSRTEDLFFVADGTGGHVFAKTLAEHNENVRRWREIQRRMRQEAEAAAAEAAAESSETN